MSTTCYCVLLRKASRKVSSLYDEALAPLGVNIAQFSLLRNLRKMAPVSLTDLGERLELDRSTIGRNTKVLQKMGLVSQIGGADHRETLLGLTAEGERVLVAGAPIWDGIQEKLEDKLGADRAAQLHDLLALL